MPDEYKIAYAEVLEIINNISIKDYVKIPLHLIKHFEKNASKVHKYKYNRDMTLDEQNISNKAKTIIAILFRDYWATPEQKKKIIAKENYDKQMKYNPNNIFENKKQYDTYKSVELVPYKKSFWNKIIDMIRKIYRK